MPLECDFLTHDVLTALNRRIQRLEAEHPLRKECVDGAVEIQKYEDVLVFHSAVGFYFERMKMTDVETELIRHIKAKRDYHCSAFEVDEDDPTVVDKLRVRFQEQYGVKMARMIDDTVIHFKRKKLMLVKFPSCVLRFMLAPTGGYMKTAFSGPIDALKQIPTLLRLNAFEHAVEVDGRTKSVVVTEYKPHQYQLVQRIHWDIVRDVIKRPHAGISIHCVGVWDA